VSGGDPPDVPAAVAEGVRLFNRGRYFEAHEVWEAAFVDAAGTDRAFLEGLVQLATGLHLRTRRGATRGAENLIAQALVTLEDFRPRTHDVDVEALVAEFGAWLDGLRAERRPHRLRDTLRIPRLR
jgi:predicted metal-dependent hydrolase